jgi:hypothetical protein
LSGFVAEALLSVKQKENAFPLCHHDASAALRKDLDVPTAKISIDDAHHTFFDDGTPQREHLG